MKIIPEECDALTWPLEYTLIMELHVNIRGCCFCWAISYKFVFSDHFSREKKNFSFLKRYRTLVEHWWFPATNPWRLALRSRKTSCPFYHTRPGFMSKGTPSLWFSPRTSICLQTTPCQCPRSAWCPLTVLTIDFLGIHLQMICRGLGLFGFEHFGKNDTPKLWVAAVKDHRCSNCTRATFSLSKSTWTAKSFILRTLYLCQPSFLEMG